MKKYLWLSIPAFFLISIMVSWIEPTKYYTGNFVVISTSLDNTNYVLIEYPSFNDFNGRTTNYLEAYTAHPGTLKIGEKVAIKIRGPLEREVVKIETSK